MKFLSVLLAFFMFGCMYENASGDVDSSVLILRPKPIGVSVWNKTYKVETVCLRGVEYYMIGLGRQGYMSPALKPNGKPYTCLD
jgi:hypothetical protein